jgi:hypothetical protein
MKSAVIVAWLAAELLKLPGSHAPGETREEYEARVRDIAASLVDEAIPIAQASHGWTVTEIAAAGGIIWHGEIDNGFPLANIAALYRSFHRCTKPLTKPA